MWNVHHYRATWLLLLSAWLLYACAVGQIERPQTAEENLAVAQAALTGAYDTIRTLSQAGELSLRQYDKLMDIAYDAEKALKTARQLLRLDPSGDGPRLQKINELLLLLQTAIKQEQTP